MRISLILFLGMISPAMALCGGSQDSIKNKTHPFYFTLRSGGLIGCSYCALGKVATFSMAADAGILWRKNLKIGGGLGFDSYEQRVAIPAFATIHWRFAGKKNGLFFQNDIGYSKAWRRKISNELNTTEQGGFMMRPALGWEIRYHDLRLSFSGGWKFQQIFTTHEFLTYIYNGNVMEQSSTTYYIKTAVRRVSFMVGISWR